MLYYTYIQYIVEKTVQMSHTDELSIYTAHKSLF